MLSSPSNIFSVHQKGRDCAGRYTFICELVITERAKLRAENIVFLSYVEGAQVIRTKAGVSGSMSTPRQ